MSEDPADPLSRLAIDDGPDDDELITIAEEEISSRSEKATAVGVRGAVDLTTDQALWLYEALGKVLVGRGDLPLPTIEVAEKWLASALEGDLLIAPKMDTEQLCKSLSLLLEAQRAQGERCGFEQCPAKPEDRVIIQTALKSLLSDESGIEDTLTVLEWERAAELALYLESEDLAAAAIANEQAEAETAES